MQASNWSTEMALGLPAMDELHHGFFVKLSECEVMPDAEFAVNFDMLVDDVERDFATEEQWMEEINFPAIQSHLEQHARVLSALHHAQSCNMAGDFTQGRAVVRLLPQWLGLHISTMDAALAIAIEIVRNQEVQIPKNPEPPSTQQGSLPLG